MPSTQFPCGATTLAYVLCDINGQSINGQLCCECIHQFRVVCIYGYADNEDDESDDETESICDEDPSSSEEDEVANADAEDPE